MSPLETLRAALMALRDHKLRSGLTALGIIIGTSATIAMLAVGAGARAQVAAQVQSLGSNLLIIVSGNVNQSGVKLGAGATPTLTDEDAAAIGQEIFSVQVTSSLITGKIQVVAEAANWATNVATVDPGYFEVRDWAVESGRVFEADEAKNGAQVAHFGTDGRETIVSRRRCDRSRSQDQKRALPGYRNPCQERPVHRRAGSG